MLHSLGRRSLTHGAHSSMSLQRKLKTALDRDQTVDPRRSGIFGFQFNGAFQELFDDLPNSSRYLHCAAKQGGMVMVPVAQQFEPTVKPLWSMRAMRQDRTLVMAATPMWTSRNRARYDILVMATLFGMFPFLQKLFAEGGYQGPEFSTALAKVRAHLNVEIVLFPEFASSQNQWTAAFVRGLQELRRDGVTSRDGVM
jgi:hypothetical protein